MWFFVSISRVREAERSEGAGVPLASFLFFLRYKQNMVTTRGNIGSLTSNTLTNHHHHCGNRQEPAHSLPTPILRPRWSVTKKNA